LGSLKSYLIAIEHEGRVAAQPEEAPAVAEKS